MLLFIATDSVNVNLYYLKHKLIEIDICYICHLTKEWRKHNFLNYAEEDIITHSNRREKPKAFYHFSCNERRLKFLNIKSMHMNTGNRYSKYFKDLYDLFHSKYRKYL